MKKIYSIALSILCIGAVYSQTYTDVAISQGINFTNSGFYGGGVSFSDFNKDGFDDISIASSGVIPIGCFKNTGSTFQAVNIQVCSNAAKSDCILWADYDNDGYEDLLITSFGGITRLYHNTNNVDFTEVTTSAGLSLDSMYATGACWGDYDNDGYIDMYVSVYRGFMGSSMDIPDMLYHNDHNGHFTNVTQAAGVLNTNTMPFCPAFFDYNNDGLLDLYIASDHLRGNVLYKNNGNGTFSNVSAASHSDVHGATMGLAIGDYDNNGYLDLYISNGEQGNYLLKNNGDGTFTDEADTYGVGVYRICWGNNFIDYNNDGMLDIFCCTSNGAPDHKPYLFKNMGAGGFTRVTGIGLDQQHYSYGTAAGDINNDGYPDISVVNWNDPANLYKSSGGTNKWLKVKLNGNATNRDGIGSRIEIYAGGTRQIRPVLCGQSYLSQNSYVQMIGLGNSAVVDSLIVKWQSGWTTTLTNVDVNQTLVIDENSPIGIIHNGNGIPSEYNLMQNYPNPFNPSTRIKYALPKSGYVTLEVFDILGNKVASLVNAQQQAGYYETEFNASALASGIYFYKLSAGSYTSSNKMVLVK